jgi:Domain of unknown function (DUF4157)
MGEHARAKRTQSPGSKPTAPLAVTPTSAAKPSIPSAFNPAWGRLAFGLQAKLTVSAPDDPYEREADAVADRVMRMADPAFVGSAPAAVQRKCACGGRATCTCEEDEEKPIQAKRVPSVDPAAPVHATAAAHATKNGGAPLPTAVRSYFEPRFGYDFSDVQVHADAEAAIATRAIQARAYTLGRNILFGAGEYAPSMETGRRLLAHELTHVVQQGIGRETPSGTMLGHESHEREADRSPSRALTGGTVRALTPYRGSAPQLAPAAPTMPPAAEMRAWLSRFKFVPVAGSTLKPGLADRQFYAMVVRRLLDTQYVLGFGEQVYDARAQNFALWTGGEKVAQGGETFPTLNVDPEGLLEIIQEIAKAGKTVTLQPDKQEILNLGIAAEQATNMLIIGGGNRWFSNDLKIAMMGSRAALLRTLWKALLKDKVDLLSISNLGTESLDAAMNLLSSLVPAADAIDAIRADPSLTNHPIYRKLWPSKAAKDAGPAGSISSKPDTSGLVDPYAAPVAAADQVPVFSTAVGVMTYFETQPTLIADAVKWKPAETIAAAAARRELLDRYGEVEGATNITSVDPSKQSQTLQDTPSIYNTPPYPATLSAYPQIVFPTYDASTKGEYAFTMTLQFTNPFAFFLPHQYKFEKIAIPKADVKGAAKAAGPLPAGEEPSTWRRLEGRLAKDADYDQADVDRYWGGLRYRMGPPGVSIDPIAINSALRVTGTLIKTTLFEGVGDPYEVGRFTFDQEGAYLIRATSHFDAGPNAKQRRPPSIAYHPVFAREPALYAQGKLDELLLDQEAAKKRLEEIADQWDDPWADRAQLADDKEKLTAMTGDVPAMLEYQKKTLAKQKAASTDKYEQDRIQDSIDVIDKILKNRKDRGITVGAERLFGVFVSSATGQAAYLLLETQDVTAETDKANADKPRSWIVNDATAPSGRSTVGTGPDKESAILDGVKQIFDKGDYGRGNASVKIGNVVKEIVVMTVGPGAVFKEAMGNIATILSIAAVAAAPFTDGASLVLLVPAGVIGAVPSAYRLIERGIDHNLYVDMETAMDIVNIVGAAVGVGAEAQAAKKAFTLASGALLLVGVANAGTGIFLMGAQLVKQIRSLDDLPESLRSAAMLEILGSAMLNAGIMIGGMLMAKGKLTETEKTLSETGGTIDSWWKGLNEETQKELNKPERAATKSAYFRMSPVVRELLTLCASICVPMDPPPTAAQQLVIEKLGGKLDRPQQRLLKGMLHDANAGSKLGKLLDSLKKLSDDDLKKTVDVPANVAGAVLVSFSESVKGGADPKHWTPEVKALRALVESVMKDIGGKIGVDRVGAVLDNVRRTKGGKPDVMLEYLRQLGTRAPKGWEKVLADLEGNFNMHKGAKWVLSFVTESGLWDKVQEFEIPAQDEWPVSRRWDVRIAGQLYQLKSWQAFYETKFLGQILEDYLASDRFTAGSVKWVFEPGLGTPSQIVKMMRDALKNAYESKRPGFDASTVDGIRDMLPKIVEVGARAPVKP